MVYRVRPAFGLGQRKAFAGLLNIDAQFLGNAVQGGTDAEAGDPVGNGDADDEDNDARYQPFADLSYGLKHLPSILRQPAQGQPKCRAEDRSFNEIAARSSFPAARG